MGQGWSQEYANTDIYNQASATTSAGLGPKIRSDSEPPTSVYGGTKLNVNIPEDEELKTTHTELAQLTNPIASADWKRASGDSGILKEKSAALSALLESKEKSAALSTLLDSNDPQLSSATFSGYSSLLQNDVLVPPKPRERAQSVGSYAHFVDFSLFPDKFGATQLKSRHQSSSSNHSDEEKSIPRTPPPTPNITTPLQSVANVFFRARALSDSKPTMSDTSQGGVTKSPSVGVGIGNQIKTDKLDIDAQPAIRPRSASYGSGKKYERHKGVHADRQPFADFTFFPDKDPKFGENVSNALKDKGIYENLQTKDVDLLPKKSQPTLSTASGQPPTVIITQDNINYVNSAALIASALAMEANKNSRNTNSPKISPQEKSMNNNNIGKPAQQRFSFFDYSMIPDKDPRTFVPNNKQKGQQEGIFANDRK